MASGLRIASHVTRPTRTLAAMAVFLICVGAVGWLLYQSISAVFQANIYLNGLIAFVFVVGVGYCFWQVLRLSSCVDWIEAFHEERPGLDAIKPPRLLASTAALLRSKEARRGLSSSTLSSILDSIAVRFDESRDIARYISSLLIFLGLLGTFWGLSLTVPAVVDTIRTLAPKEGADAFDFGALMSGLERQLGGMGTAFASSLLGLAGSLIVGFLELLAGHAQNRFYREFEDSLSLITNVSRSEDGGVASAHIAEMLERNSYTMADLTDAMTEGESERRAATQRLDHAARAMETVAERMQADETARERLVDSQGRLRSALETAVERNKGVIGGMDEGTRNHIRNMDAQLLRLAEEVASGRQDAVADLRAELKMLARSFAAIADRGLGERR